MRTIFFTLLTFIIFLSGCHFLLSSDPTFSNEKYEEFYELENYEGALQRVEERLQKYPKDPFLHNEKGFILLELEQNEKALAAFDYAIQSNDKNVLDSAHNNKAIALTELGRYEEAIDHAKKSIELEKNDPEAYLSMANALFYLERLEEALTYYDIALDINPSEENALFGKGAVLYESFELEEAKQVFTQYLDLEPNDLGAYWYFVFIYDDMGEYEKAIDYLDAIYETDAEDELEILEYKGLLYAYMDEMDQSLEVYETLLQKYPDDPYSHYGKAIALINLGEVEKGIDALHNSIRLEPSIIDIAQTDPFLEDIQENDSFIDLINMQP